MTGARRQTPSTGLRTFFMRKQTASRQQVEELATGRPLNQLPELHIEVAKLKVVPTVERRIEGQHSLVCRSTVHRKVSGACVSLRLPMSQVANALRNDSDWVKQLALQIEAHPGRLTQQLGLGMYPALLCLQFATVHRQRWRKILAAVVYRCDAESQF